MDAAIDARSPDGGPIDARSPDGGSLDGGSRDGGPIDGPTATAITIRVYNDGVPSFTGITENVPLLAFQDGDGAWTALSGTDGVYHATARNQRYSVAVGCGVALVNLVIYYQSISDATDLAVDGCFREAADPADVTVSILNGDGRQNTVSIGGASASVTGNATVHLTVPRRLADVFAVSLPAGGGPPVPTAHRGPTLNVTANTSLSIDISAAQEVETHPLTVVDTIPPEHSETIFQVQSKYLTAHSYGQLVLLDEALSTSHPDAVVTGYKTVAAAGRQASDLIYVRARTRGTTPSGFSYDRLVDIQNTNAVELTMTLPDIFIADAPTVDNAPIPRATAKLPMRPPTLGNAIYQLDLVTDNRTVRRTVDIVVRPGWAQGAPNVTVATPDLSGLAGWTSDMALLSDTDVEWTILIDDRNMVLGTPVTDGKRILETFLFATIERHPGPGPTLARPTAAGASCRGACGARRDRFAQ